MPAPCPPASLPCPAPPSDCGAIPEGLDPRSFRSSFGHSADLWAFRMREWAGRCLLLTRRRAVQRGTLGQPTPGTPPRLSLQAVQWACWGAQPSPPRLLPPLQSRGLPTSARPLRWCRPPTTSRRARAGRTGLHAPCPCALSRGARVPARQGEGSPGGSASELPLPVSLFLSSSSLPLPTPLAAAQVFCDGRRVWDRRPALPQAAAA